MKFTLPVLKSIWSSARARCSLFQYMNMSQIKSMGYSRSAPDLQTKRENNNKKKRRKETGPKKRKTKNHENKKEKEKVHRDIGYTINSSYRPLFVRNAQYEPPVSSSRSHCTVTSLNCLS